MIIRPSFTVLSGAAIGLVAGAAVYGAVATASAATPTAVKPPKTVAAAPALAARCAPDQKLEDGVCIVNVVKTVVVPAPSAAGAEAPTTAQVSGVASDTDRDGGLSAPSDDATEAGKQSADDATEGAEDATDDATGETDAAADDGGSDLSGPEQGAGAAGSDDDSSDAPRG